MQLFGIRGGVTYALMFVVGGVLLALGVDVPLALVGGLLGGTAVALLIFALPGVGRAADDAQRWMDTPK